VPDVKQPQTGHLTSQGDSTHKQAEPRCPQTALTQALSESSFPISVDIDKSICTLIMDDHTTALMQATRRLIKIKINCAIKERRTDKHRWTA